MTNKEILAELKQSYEYLYDIRENGCSDHCNGQLDINNIKTVENIMEKLAELYNNIRTNMQDDECLLIFNNTIYVIGHTISEDYNVPSEDTIVTCADLNYYWYQDKDFIGEQ